MNGKNQIQAEQDVSSIKLMFSDVEIQTCFIFAFKNLDNS